MRQQEDFSGDPRISLSDLAQRTRLPVLREPSVWIARSSSGGCFIQKPNPLKPVIKMTYPKPGIFLPAGLLLCAPFTIARGDTITQTVGNIDWNAAMWGTPAAAPTAGNTYVSATGVTNNTFRISAAGTASTFGGGSITVVAGTRALMKNQNGAIATINGDLTLDGGRLSHAPNTGPHAGTLQVTNLVVSGTGSFIDINGVSTLTINGTLTGSGDLLLKPELASTGAATISIASIIGYTGALTVQAPVRLDFGSSYTFTNSLTLQTTAILNVDQSLTIEEGKLIANGVTIPAGTYTGAGITGLGANFVDGGGTLTVVAKDTDADGLPDYWENLIINADPGDLVDGFEDVAGPNNAPTATDFDSDGRSDAAEFANGVVAQQSDPLNPDTDSDGLLDGPEAAGTNNNGVATGFGPTSPKLKDSDADGFDDPTELHYGFNPNNASIIPGSTVNVVNGSFEEPEVTTTGTAALVSSGTVPGWSLGENDFYVVRTMDFTDANNPAVAKHGLQFATADRRAPNPDVDPTALSQGADSSMIMKQEIDVSSLATEIDAGTRSLLLDYEFRDNDTADQGVVTIQFFNAGGTDLGRRSVFNTPNAGADWVHHRQGSYPPVGTRKISITVAATKVQAGTTSVRNIHYDNFTARLVHFDLDNDNMADDWELTYGLDPDSSADAGESLDLDTLTNLQEFQRGTNPTLVDTDDDGIEDDIEVLNGTDPTDAASPGTRPHVTDFITTKNGAGQITKIEVVFNGLVPNKTYTLVRGTDLASFPDTIETKLATGTTYTFTDSAPLPDGSSSKAFYRLQD